MGASYRLGNAQALSKRHKSFSVPSQDALRALGRGGVVKLIFLLPEGAREDGCDGERMFVRITRATEGVFVGTLLNVPTVIAGLPLGEAITFRREHVAAIDDAN